MDFCGLNLVSEVFGLRGLGVPLFPTGKIEEVFAGIRVAVPKRTR